MVWKTHRPLYLNSGAFAQLLAIELMLPTPRPSPGVPGTEGMVGDSIDDGTMMGTELQAQCGKACRVLVTQPLEPQWAQSPSQAQRKGLSGKGTKTFSRDHQPSGAEGDAPQE